jgi:hopanoid biosynthesis associated protein HpnK
VRRLIVNADDFGLTPGINRGIAEAAGHGIVTSTTLMANVAAFDEAVRIAQSSPALGVGCHVMLIDGAPLVKASQVSSLLAAPDAGKFPDSLAAFATRALRGKLNPSQIEAEATAQFRKLQAAGVRITHFDTHKHTHMFPAVLEPLLQAARKCGVRAVRNPLAPRLAGSILIRKMGLWKRYAQTQALRVLGGKFRRQVAEAGLLTTDGSFGVEVTGKLDEALFRDLAACIPDGTWELVCHPGYNDEALRAVKTRLRASREVELRLLTARLARDILAEHGVELVSYRDLVGNPSSAATPGTVVTEAPADESPQPA